MREKPSIKHMASLFTGARVAVENRSHQSRRV
jgi:hypothetical protein